MKLSVGISLIMMLLIPAAVSAYDSTKVHPAINEKAAIQALNINPMLENQGFPDGLDEKIQGPDERLSIKDWIKKGGTAEDAFVRPVLHFHDPLQPWSNAGLWGTTSASVDWAQRSDNESSWQKARDHYYQALTTGSETEYANTFRTIGQLMHLVSDMGVPAHVRDDAHLIGDPYETWTADSKNFELLDFTGIEVDPAIFSQALTTSEAPAPITALWDLDIYNGTNPGITLPPAPLPPMRGLPPIPVSGGMKAGMAEYTNANFFSKDTFTGYAYPDAGVGTLQNVDWIYPEEVVAEDGKPDTRVYYWDNVGNKSIRKAGTSLITLDVMAKNHNPPWQIDDNVSRDYASLLVPAAAGYSTALLDYFSRGDIDLTSDPSASGYFIVNNSDEELTGTFAVYYDDISGTRRKLPGAEWVNTTVVATGRIPVGSITIPDDHAVPPKYFLVFKGKMGGEDGAVAGRVVSLKPFGLLAIKISGNLYNAKGNRSGGAGPMMYIVWDVGHDAPLVLPKTGGGYWSYPLSAADYAGPFLADLRALLGAETSVQYLPPLFSINYENTSAIPVDASKLIHQTTTGVDLLPPGPLDNDRSYGPTSFKGWPYDPDPSWIMYTGTPVIYGLVVPVPEGGRGRQDWIIDPAGSYGTVPPAGSVANGGGGTDSYQWSGSQAFDNWATRQGWYYVIHDVGYDYYATYIEADGKVAGDSVSSQVDLEFNLAAGGGHERLFLGFPSWPTYPNYLQWFALADVTVSFTLPTTDFPAPARGKGAVLTCLNASAAPVTTLGPAVAYTGTLQTAFRRQIEISVTSGGHKHLLTATGLNTASGLGTLTALDGTEHPIAYDFTESWTKGPYNSVAADTAPLAAYAGARDVTFATDSFHVASGYENTDNYLAMVAVQSVASGDAKTQLSAPVPPAAGTESSPIFSDMATSYHLRAICAAVEDAATQNPWELPDNSGLIDELQRAIAVYVAANPPGGNNHWNISTGIYKIQ